MQDVWVGPSRRDYGLWVVICALAELIGIAAGAAWWIAMDQIAPAPLTLAGKVTMLALKSLSGLLEGTVLGLLQAIVLRRLYPRLPMPGWVVLTVLLAIFGWAVGSAIPIFGGSGNGELPEPPLPLMLSFAALFGLLVGALFGGVQAFALRRAARHSGWWIPFNAAGWAAALPVIYFGASLPNESASSVQAVVAGLLSGAVAGLILGIVTGFAFERMAPK